MRVRLLLHALPHSGYIIQRVFCRLCLTPEAKENTVMAAQVSGHLPPTLFGNGVSEAPLPQFAQRGHPATFLSVVATCGPAKRGSQSQMICAHRKQNLPRFTE